MYTSINFLLPETRWRRCWHQYKKIWLGLGIGLFLVYFALSSSAVYAIYHYWQVEKGYQTYIASPSYTEAIKEQRQYQIWLRQVKQASKVQQEEWRKSRLMLTLLDVAGVDLQFTSLSFTQSGWTLSGQGRTIEAIRQFTSRVRSQLSTMEVSEKHDSTTMAGKVAPAEGISFTMEGRYRESSKGNEKGKHRS